jgi:CheY-like chemotaxis protein
MKQTLLVVDDDIDALHLLCLILEKQGFSVIRATDGSEAIQKTIQEKPDLILMDVTMPGKDGYEVTRLIKSDEKLSNIPIIMLTAKEILTISSVVLRLALMIISQNLSNPKN